MVIDRRSETNRWTGHCSSGRVAPADQALVSKPMAPAGRMARAPPFIGLGRGIPDPAGSGRRDRSVGVDQRGPQRRRLAGRGRRHAAVVGYCCPLGQREGTFGRPIPFDGPTGINALAAVDVDGDGDLDLIAGGGEGQNAGFSVLRNLGVDGQAWAGLETPINVVRAESPTALVARDFDGDGHVDVALASTVDVSVFLGQGDGTFGDPISYAAGPGRRSLAAGHFDADGDLDLVVANDSSGQVTVLMGSGDGTFEPHDEVVTLSVLGQGQNWPLAEGDFDQDGDLDLAVGQNYGYGNDHNIAVLLGKGDGSFEPEPIGHAVVGVPTQIAAGDVDEDGDLDLAVTGLGTFHHPQYGNSPLGNGRDVGSWRWIVRSAHSTLPG